MAGFSIAIEGQGRLFQVWPSHAMTRFPRATIYDRSAATTALRRGEVNLGRTGRLNPAGRAAAERTARNLANPPPVDATVSFSEQVVKVKCKRGREKTFRVRLLGISDKAIRATFAEVDAAIEGCAGRRMQV